MPLLLEYPLLLLICGGLFGLLIGSFLNVLILRVPPRLYWDWRQQAREVLELPAEPADLRPPGWVLARSACPKCQRQLSAGENIPLLSFLLQRGRCRGCAAPISWQYPLVETAAALMTVAVLASFGPTIHALYGLVFSYVLLTLAVIDLRTMLLPDEFTLPLFWAGILLALIGHGPTLEQAVIGGMAGYGVLWTVFHGFKLVTGKEGMGYGDFKLMAALGAWMGPEPLLPVLILSAGIGAIVGGAYLWLQRAGADQPIPFGPFIAGAGWVCFVYREPVLAVYERALGLV